MCAHRVRSLQRHYATGNYVILSAFLARARDMDRRNCASRVCAYEGNVHQISATWPSLLLTLACGVQIMAGGTRKLVSQENTRTTKAPRRAVSAQHFSTPLISFVIATHARYASLWKRKMLRHRANTLIFAATSPTKRYSPVVGSRTDRVFNYFTHINQNEISL